MGYFKRPIRRRAARATADAFRDGSAGLLGRHRVRPETYLRFIVQTPRDGAVGLFRTSDLFDDDLETGAFLPDADEALERAYRWFNANVRVPRHLPRAAVCWFREDAREAIAALRTIVECHRLAGRPVTMLATRQPGRIVYRDAVQVAAVPYDDQRRTSSTW